MLSIKACTLEDLASEDRIIRLITISESFSDAGSASMLEALKARSTLEKDPECRELLQLAIEIISIRLEPTELEKLSDTDSVFSNFEQYSRAQILTFLYMLTQEQISSTIELATAVFTHENDPLIKTAILNTYRFNWPKEKLHLIVECLKLNYNCLKIASIETLITLSPNKLLDFFPKLLLNNDPRVRGAAIKALSRLDSKEAIRHLILMFETQKTSFKLVAIQNAFFFSFSSIKTILLNYLTIETDPKLLLATGIIFAINPDKEIPFKLWNTLNKSKAEKQKLIKRIAEDSYKILFDSKQTELDKKAFFENLNKYMLDKNAEEILQAQIMDLCNETFEEKDELQSLLNHKLNDISSTLHRFASYGLLNTFSANIKTVLDLTNKIAQPNDPSSEATRNLSKIYTITAFNNPDSQQEKDFATETFLNARSKKLQAAALRALIRLNINNFINEAELLKDTEDENLLAAVIEYLAFCSYSHYEKEILQYLNSSAPEIQNTAVKIILSNKPLAESLTVVRAIIKNNFKNPNSHYNGFLIALNLEFTLVLDLIEQYLINNPNSEFLNQIMYLYLCNPNTESLSSLYRIRSNLDESQLMLINKTIAIISELLTQRGFISRAGLIELQNEATSHYLSNTAETIPAYAAELLFPQEKKRKPSFKELTKRYSFTLYLFSCITLCILTFFYFYSFSSPANKIKKKTNRTSKFGQMLSNQFEMNNRKLNAQFFKQLTEKNKTQIDAIPFNMSDAMIMYEIEEYYKQAKRINNPIKPLLTISEQNLHQISTSLEKLLTKTDNPLIEAEALQILIKTYLKQDKTTETEELMLEYKELSNKHKKIIIPQEIIIFKNQLDALVIKP